MSASKLVLGGVNLAYCEMRWPFYRGMTPREVTIDQPSALYDQLKAMALSLGGNPTYLYAEGPAQPGTNPGVAGLYVAGVYVASVALLDSMRCRVTLYDRRYELHRRVMDKSFNLSFGDGYMEGTEQASYLGALEDIVDSIDLLKASLADDAYASVPDRTLPEDLLLDGQPLLTALGMLGESGGFDLAVNTEGKYYFASREDINLGTLPSKSSYSWVVEPGWVVEDNVQLQRPRNIKVYATERHCLRLLASDPRTTIPLNGPDELRVELEQVYASEGKIYTLAELLNAYGYAANAISDLEIANVIMTETFQGTLLAVDGTANNRAVINAIKDGWRTLWRIKFSEDVGRLGGWYDWEFGKLNDDGSVSEVAVDCEWTEFLNVLDLPENAPTTIDSFMTVGHLAPSPFIADWEMGAADGIIRLRQKNLKDGNIAMPGALVRPLRVRVKQSVDTEEGDPVPLDQFEIVEMEDRGKAQFARSFEMAVYVCATRRAPNNETRWHVDVIEGYPDGDIEDVEIPPGAQMCYRDYVNDSGFAFIDPDFKPRLEDGMGVKLNNLVLREEAERRAEAWKIAFGQRASGEGIAQSVMLANEWKVDGSIAEISLDATIEGQDVQVFRSRMQVGGLLDADAIERRAAIAVKERGMREAGKQIA